MDVLLPKYMMILDDNDVIPKPKVYLRYKKKLEIFMGSKGWPKMVFPHLMVESHEAFLFVCHIPNWTKKNPKIFGCDFFSAPDWVWWI